MDNQRVQIQAAGSQITPNSWHLNPDILIPSSLHGHDWQAYSLQSWRRESKRRKDVPSPEYSLMTCPTEHSGPSVSRAFSCRLLAYKFPSKACSFISDIVSLPELSCTTTYALSCFPDEHSLCFAWSHHCNFSGGSTIYRVRQQSF